MSTLTRKFVGSLLNHARRERRRGGPAVLCLLLAAACSPSPPPSTAPSSAPDPGIEPGDAVRLDFWREPDVSGMYRVDDRGIVTLPLLGDRQVAGVAPDELRENLLEDYREYLKNPSIEVTVLRRVTILGAVTTPGLYQVDATLSLSEALAMAGGMTPAGDPDDVRLVRDGRVIQQAIDPATMIAAVDIRSGDQVVVGEKGWLARNPGAMVGSLLGASAVIITALLR